jgi:hypothetical protein
LTLAQSGVTTLAIRFQPPGGVGSMAGLQTATIICIAGGGTTLLGFPLTLNGTVIELPIFADGFE